MKATAPKSLLLALLLAMAPVAPHFDSATGGFSLGVRTAAADQGSGGGSGSGSGSGGGGSSHSGSDSHGDDGDDHDTSGKGGAGDSGKNGTHVQNRGGDIVIVYRDGFREEIHNGRLKLQDPDGHVIVERAVTAKDRSRIKALQQP